MTQKNDTPALLLAFLITAGLVGGGFWWFTQRSGIGLKSGQTGQTSASDDSTASNRSSNSPTQGTVEGFASVQSVPSGLFNYGGSTSWAPLRLAVDPAIQQARPEFRLRYVEPIGSPPGSSTGIRMLIRDELAFAQSSRPLLNQEYQQAEQRGVKLKQIPVAIDGLAVAVNPSLNIPGLTIAQLQGIYRGQITNWSQVGGPDLKVQPFTRPIQAGGTIELFVEEILQGGAFGANVQTVSTTTEALRKLAANPGGIYFASAPEVVPQCTIKPLPLGRRSGEYVPPYRETLVAPSQCPGQRNQLNVEAFQSGQYPITRSLYVVVKQNGRVEEQAGEAYANFLLTNQGQELIARSGFVKIR
ncbi:PstS family phosphate ABC transporter substrate-binding protein [Kovacikia minuta CCNUW1]|uniref:PstS family phosphate ABC transporter substrate-binding protein n=1 Tax=Kovacikia minuta TaxID=2931930 RepID=UPI001CCA223E|nr:PstS family phosphate ABC transporter substrate-binding protein [Kovacikia minuta]UBF24051.1 PstS family phosphate ABC transporter substrate-binding protein [Kovacikia minuta CCNUW1]